MNKSVFLALSICFTNFFARAEKSQSNVFDNTSFRTKIADRLDTCAAQGLDAQKCENQIFKLKDRLLKYDTVKDMLKLFQEIEGKTCSTPIPTDDCVLIRDMYKILQNKERAVLKEVRSQQKESRKLL